MIDSVAFIGFGEAGAAFAESADWRSLARAFDIQPGKDADYRAAGVRGCARLGDAVRDARDVICVVTAAQALIAARRAARHIAADAFYFDMNSVAPDTKRAAALAIEGAGGRHVDVAVMAPVLPARLAVPLLVSGPHADGGAERLRAIGFGDVRVVSGGVGAAASIKMIRSVMIKGIEALTAEMMLAADAAGVADEVLASLGGGWNAKARYNLERMTAHGERRAAEMEEAVRTLTALGVEPVMTRGTVIRQRAMATTRGEELPA